jgi:hypothetical protein
VFARESWYAADMIAMLVGHDNGIEVCRLQAEACQPPLRFAQAEAAIKHYARDCIASCCLDNQGVAFTARSE